jgi:Transposase IS200 like
MTTRICPGLPNLRESRAHSLLLATLKAGCDRFGFRLVEFSVQRDHFHLIVEVADRLALTRGAKGLGVRVARALNRLWGRTGRVIDDRYHARELGSPLEVRHGLVYVLHNARKHGQWGRGIDPFSTGPWFDGFAKSITTLAASTGAGPPAGGVHFASTERLSCGSGGYSIALKGDGTGGVARVRRDAGVQRNVVERSAEAMQSAAGVQRAAALLARWPRPACRARTWLLAIGWRRLGAIDPDERPRTPFRFSESAQTTPIPRKSADDTDFTKERC